MRRDEVAERVAAELLARGARELPRDGGLGDDGERLDGGDVAALDERLRRLAGREVDRARAASSASAAASSRRGRRSPRRSRRRASMPPARFVVAASRSARDLVVRLASRAARRARSRRRSRRPSPPGCPSAPRRAARRAGRPSSRTSRAPAARPRARTSTTPPTVSRSVRASSTAPRERLLARATAPATSIADLARAAPSRPRRRRRAPPCAARDARSSASRTSSSPYFSTPARSAWPGRGSVTGFVPLPVRLALGRPRAHPPRPVLVVAVPDDERERRAERAAVAEAGEHLDLVRLDLLARASGRSPAGGGAGRRRSRRGRARARPAGPVTIATSAGPCDSPAVASSRRHARKPTAMRAHDVDGRRHARPELERRGALRDEHLEPVDDRRARRARAAACAVSRPSGIGEVDERLARARARTSTSSRPGVALTTRSARRRSRAASRRGARRRSPGCRAPRAPRSRRLPRRPRRSRPALSALDLVERLGVGARADHASVPDDERVHRVGALGDSSSSWQNAITLVLCGVVTFAPAKPRATSPATASPSRCAVDAAAARTPSRARARRTRRSASAATATARPGRRAARRASSSPRSRPPAQYRCQARARAGARHRKGCCHRVRCLYRWRTRTSCGGRRSSWRRRRRPYGRDWQPSAPPPSGPPRSSAAGARTSRLCSSAAVRSGLSVAEMAEALGISRQWTNHLAKHAVDRGSAQARPCPCSSRWPARRSSRVLARPLAGSAVAVRGQELLERGVVGREEVVPPVLLPRVVEIGRPSRGARRPRSTRGPGCRSASAAGPGTCARCRASSSPGRTS